jgi:hypothetical protein
MKNGYANKERENGNKGTVPSRQHPSGILSPPQGYEREGEATEPHFHLSFKAEQPMSQAEKRIYANRIT